jgi:hypothetical protein
MTPSTETKVINTQDGEPGIILNRYGPDSWEVITDFGIEVWQEADVQAAAGDPAEEQERNFA